MRLVCLALCLATGSAAARDVTPLATVTTDSMPATLLRIGDHQVSLTSFTCDGDACHVDALDTRTRKLRRIPAARKELERHFGRPAQYRSLELELLFLDATRAGFLVENDEVQGSTRYYAELDARTGAILRSTKLGTWQDNVDVYPIGADTKSAWFFEQRYDGPRLQQLHFNHEKSAHTLVIRKIDLQSLAVTDVASIALPQRKGWDHELFVHAAADFSRFAFVEYREEPAGPKPAASIYIVDSATGAHFTVAAPEVVYALAFSPDRKYAYYSSAVTGQVSRLDLATRKVDLVVRGPKLTHHAAISADGKRLFMLTSSRGYVAFDLPSFKPATELKHKPSVADGFGSLAAIDAGLMVVPIDRDDDQRDYTIVELD